MNIRTNKAGRKVLANLFKGTGAELGVESGKFSLEILQTCDKLYCVDLWASYGEYRTHVTTEAYDEIYERCKKRLAKYDVGYVRSDTLEAAKLFEDEYLDFVYHDSNHTFEHLYRELNTWYPKIKKGGIVSGHDYVSGFGKKDGLKYGVIEAVQQFCSENSIPEIIVWTGDSSHSFHFLKV